MDQRGQRRRDVTRQAANVAGALFQVGATAALAAGIQDQVDQGTPLIEPAPYAFSIWGVIFPLSVAYAVYAALPRNRESTLLRRVGWLTVPAFLCTGLRSFFVPAGRTLLALGVLFVALVCLLLAYLRLASPARDRHPSAADSWIVAPALGVFAGWLTAANVVSLSSEAVRLGFVGGGAQPRAFSARRSSSVGACWPRRWYSWEGAVPPRATWPTARRCSRRSWASSSISTAPRP
jgi:hypothetical protein